jgi:hypothetical protein
MGRRGGRGRGGPFLPHKRMDKVIRMPFLIDSIVYLAARARQAGSTPRRRCAAYEDGIPMGAHHPGADSSLGVS